MPPRKPKRLPLPTSGQLLASVARALDLSIPDQLAGRYFRGESVKPETRDKIVAAVARAGLSALGLDGQPDAHAGLVVLVAVPGRGVDEPGTIFQRHVVGEHHGAFRPPKRMRVRHAFQRLAPEVF